LKSIETSLFLKYDLFRHRQKLQGRKFNLFPLINRIVVYFFNNLKGKAVSNQFSGKGIDLMQKKNK